MGTSATYEIGTMKFYTHYDGYEIGVADRFTNAIKELTKPDPNALEKVADMRGGFAFALIRGNSDIEPENSIYGDYNYEIINESTKGDMSVKVTTEAGSYTSDLADFINQFSRAKSGDEVIRVEIPTFGDRYRYAYATKANAFDIGNLLKKHAETFGEGNPNRKVYMERGDAYLKAVL